MQDTYKTADITPTEKHAKIKTSVAAPQEFHFPGSGQYEPITITANSREEAEKEWIAKRKSYNE